MADPCSEPKPGPLQHTTREPARPALRLRLAAWLDRAWVQRTVLVLIVVNAALLGLETSEGVMAAAGPLIRTLDSAILALFVLEIAARIQVHRTAFFRDPWSLFDFAVVGIALVPASGAFSVLRALRVLRVLRVLTIVPSMRRVVGALLGAIPGLGAIAGVLSLLFYVFAVMATHLFGAGFPDWFGSVGKSLYTLFQVMTLESWSMGIVRPLMQSHPYAWAFFVPFILIATFTMLNLFIAIIVNAMQTFQEADAAAAADRIAEAPDRASAELAEQAEPAPLLAADLAQELRGLRSEIAALRLQFASHSTSSFLPYPPAVAAGNPG